MLNIQLKKYADAFTELYINDMSLQEYADKYFDGEKRNAQYLADKITNEFIDYFQCKWANRLNEITLQDGQDKAYKLARLYSDAEDRAFRRFAENGDGGDEAYYDIYKEEMLKVDRMLEEIEEKMSQIISRNELQHYIKKVLEKIEN